MRQSPAVRRALEIVAAATLVTSVLPLAAKHWWVLDLFTHFRLQLIAAQIILLAALVGLTRSRWSLILIGLIGINVHGSHEYLWPDARRGIAPHHLRVMTANVEARNTRAAGLVTQIEREQPDILAILEFNAAWAARLAVLDGAYPYRIEVPQSDRFGIALLARKPVLEHRVIDLGGTPAIDARIEGPTGTVRILAVHTMPPMSRHAAALRQSQLDQLAAIAAAATEPVIVLGDLNLSPYSPHFAEFLERARLHDALVGHGPSITWPTFLPLLGIPIDHCLLSSSWDSIAYRRQPAYGSDHYAIAVDLIEKTTQ